MEVEHQVQRFTRSEVYALIWSLTLKRAAAQLGVHWKNLSFACHLYGIPVPSPGYWTLLHMGREPCPDPLDAHHELGDVLEFAGSKLILPIKCEVADGRECVLSGIIPANNSTQDQKPTLKDTQRKDRTRELADNARHKLERARSAASRRQAAAEARIEKDGIRDAKVEAKRNEPLLLLRLLSSGTPRHEVAEQLGITKPQLSQRLETAKRTVRQNTGLPREVIDHLFAPRVGQSKLQNQSRRYSAAAVSVERALSLYEWEQDAWEVYQAQSLYQQFGLTCLEYQSLFRTGEEPI